MKITNFIICDDVRTEIGNKHSLIGIYDGVIEFNVTQGTAGVWPKNLKLGLFAKLFAETEEEKTKINRFKIKLIINGTEKILGENILNGKGNAVIPKITLVAVFNNFIFEGPGDYSFVLDFYDANGQLISSVKNLEPIKVSERTIG